MKSSEYIRQLNAKYTSMQYIPDEYIDQFTPLYTDEESLILLEPNHPEGYNVVHFALNSWERLVSVFANVEEPIYLSFIPDEWVKPLLSLGFIEESYYQDYWIHHLNPLEMMEPQHLYVEEANKASELTKACQYQSRGFLGEEPEFIVSWLENTQDDAVMAECHETAILKVEDQQQLAGIIIIGYYGEGDKRTLWIRELAVHPDYQNHGYGTYLLKQAFAYGGIKSCKRAFLMADTVNDQAIHLYRKVGFEVNEQEGQRNLIKKATLS